GVLRPPPRLLLPAPPLTPAPSASLPRTSPVQWGANGRHGPHQPPWDRRGAEIGGGTLCDGGVSERPKEHASKACEGATPPWVQIPPPPPTKVYEPGTPIECPACEPVETGRGPFFDTYDRTSNGCARSFRVADGRPLLLPR